LSRPDTFALDIFIQAGSCSPQSYNEFMKEVWFPDKDGRGGHLKVRFQHEILYLHLKRNIEEQQNADLEV